MNRKEVEVSEPHCLRHYDAGFEAGKHAGWHAHRKGPWIKIEDEVPPKGTKLLYFFDCTGISLGEYYGIEPDYCPETGHVFASRDGWLTGDVTHWMPLPVVPEGAYEEGWEWVEDEDET